jgi:chromosomal replication initiation ATPase DnaA
MIQETFPSLLADTHGPWWPVAASAKAYEAVCGIAPIVCLYGPTGVGKSALLELAKAQAANVYDDLDTLPEATQIQLFHVLERQRLGESTARIVVASSMPVAKLESLKPDVKSRLLLGEQIEIGYPTEPELRALLAHWAAGRQLLLPGAVADYVLARADRSPKSLKALLLKLDGLSLQEKRGITVALARQVLEEQLL